MGQAYRKEKRIFNFIIKVSVIIVLNLLGENSNHRCTTSPLSVLSSILTSDDQSVGTCQVSLTRFICLNSINGTLLVLVGSALHLISNHFILISKAYRFQRVRGLRIPKTPDRGKHVIPNSTFLLNS
jgi:hypothetical protein